MSAPDDVTVIWLPLDQWGGGGAEVLTPEERDRAGRFKSAPARRTFAACRVALRRIMGSIMGVAPAETPLRLAEGGKPFVVGGPAISLSHSGGWGVLAVGPRSLGIDVETLRELDDADGIARFFAPAEREAIAALPPGQRSATLLRLWTVKESLLKGIGQGIAQGLDGFAATVDPWEVGRAIPITGGDPAWTVVPLDSPAGTVAALASEGAAAVRVGVWDWRGDQPVFRSPVASALMDRSSGVSHSARSASPPSR